MKNRAVRLAILFVSGLSYTLAFAPFDLYIFSIISPAVYLIFLSDYTKFVAGGKTILRLQYYNPGYTKKYFFLENWVYGFGVFLGGVHWIFVSISEYGGGGSIAGFFVVILFSSVLSLYVAIPGTIFRAFKDNRYFASLLLFPALWSGFEILRGVLFTGFPWLIIGNGHVDTVFASYAPILGSYFISFVVIFLAGALVLILYERNSIYRFILLLLVFLPIIVAVNIPKSDWTNENGESISVSVVQGNIAQDIKWLPEYRNYSLNLYYKMSEPLWKNSDVIVWPETAIPAFLSMVPTYIDSLDWRAESEGKTVVFGVANDQAPHVYYNSVVSKGAQEGEYRKQNLVLFGEYLPFRDSIGDFLNFLGAPMDDFSVGDYYQAPLETGKFKAGASVCFEIAFADLISRGAKEANYLINISNDGWFGSSIGPHQHFQISRMRALENNKPLVRSTNTGISAIIAADGTVIEKTEQFKQDTATAKIYPRFGVTPYVEYGDMPTIVLILIIILLTFSITIWRKFR